MRVFVVIVAMCGLVTVDAVGQGWTQQKGEGYYQLSFRGFRSSTYFEPGGQSVDIPTLGDYVGSLYVEYGLTRSTTVIADVPFVERITRNELVGRTTGFVFTEGDAVTNISDPIVGIRYGIVSGGPTVVSASLLLGIPLGDATHPGGLWTGDGEFNQQLGLEMGHSFYPVPAFASALVGFNNRTGGFSDEIVFAVKSGYSLTSRLSAGLRIRGVEPLRNGKEDVGGQGGFGGNDVRYLQYGVEAAYLFGNRAGVQVSVDSATRKQNVLSGVMLGAGVFVQR